MFRPVENAPKPPSLCGASTAGKTRRSVSRLPSALRIGIEQQRVDHFHAMVLIMTMAPPPWLTLPGSTGQLILIVPMTLVSNC
jgi:hypothetical protein